MKEPIEKIDSWFIKIKKPHAKGRLFVFPYAGGSPNAFRDWAQVLPKEIELWVLRLPGRDSRLQEAPVRDWLTLVDNLYSVMRDCVDLPFVFFGHSFGGRVAFELTKRLQQEQSVMPKGLIISGCRAPNMSPRPPFSELPEEGFIKKLAEMGGTTLDVLNNKELMKIMEPALRADIKLSELWKSGGKVEVPIVALSGISDSIDPPSTMLDWKNNTNASFFHETYAGEHFFIHDKSNYFRETLSEYVSQLCGFSDDKILTVEKVFEKQAKIFADKIAIVSTSQKLTYRQLNAKANRLANCLIERGIQREQLVGVCMDRTTNMVVTLLAILKAGAAYLPLDPAYPPERLSYMVSDAAMSLIITEDKYNALFKNESCDVMSADDFEDYIADQSDENPDEKNNIDGLAYVNYTSGSTGQPKGVCVTHRSIINLLHRPNFVELNMSTIMLQLAPTSFDALTFELWGPLLHGGTCVLFPGTFPTLQAIKKTCGIHAVNTLFITTALFNTVIDEAPEIFFNLRYVLTGGEAHSVKHMKKAIECLPNTKIISVYGPTEATTFTTYYPVVSISSDQTAVPIGFSLQNLNLFVLDEQQKPTPNGEVGELYIGGEGLARGYLNKPHITAERFILFTLNNGEKIRLYKTGDAVRCLPNAALDFIGRTDNQVKINGFRIELGEIESVLMQHTRVKKTLVLMNHQGSVGKQLRAYIEADSPENIEGEILLYLKNKLPAYMIPSHFIVVPQFPLNANGKIDRQALQQTEMSCRVFTISRR